MPLFISLAWYRGARASVHYFSLIQRDSLIRCIGSTVLLPVIVVLSIGYGGLGPMHIWILEVAKWCCVFNFFERISRNYLIWLGLGHAIMPKASCICYACNSWKCYCYASIMLNYVMGLTFDPRDRAKPLVVNWILQIMAKFAVSFWNYFGYLKDANEVNRQYFQQAVSFAS